MSSVNKVILIGNLGKDPEIKSFSNGGKIASFAMATTEKWNDRQSGEKKEKTEWHNVTLNGDGLVGVAERYLKKGSKVYIEGKLQTRKWQDQSGADRYTTEVVVSGFGGSLVMLDGAQGGNQSSGGGSNSPRNQQADSFGDDFDDDVPFVTNDPSREWMVR